MQNSPALGKDRFTSAAAQGFRVFPVKSRSKVPALPWTDFATRSPTALELQGWDASEYNVGIICGEPSGCVVLDIDSPEAQVAVDELALPATPLVRTAKGTHLYFVSPTGGIRNSTKIAGLQLDFRGDGGYVVGSGSIHESGVEYQWEVSPEVVPFAELPKAVLDMLSKRSAIAFPSKESAFTSLEAAGGLALQLKEALARAVRQIKKAKEGARNDTLFKAGAKLAKEVAGAGVDWAPYSDALRAAALEKGLTPSEIEATLSSCWKTVPDDSSDWSEIAKEWIFLSKPEVFHHIRSGEQLKVSAFNKTFTRQRVISGTFSDFLLNGDHVSVAHDLDYRPSETETYFERDGLKWFNTYRPSKVVPAAGDAGQFVDFVSYLVPDDAERDHLFKMIAWTVRKPGQKLRHALLLRSAVQGIGKSMLVDIWGELLGKSNVRKTTTEEISGQYQGFIKETLLVLVEELNFGFGPMGYNRLKDLITGSEASVNEKFLAVRLWPNVATFVILTNLAVPMVLEASDRRIYYLDSPAQKREPEYYQAFAAWWAGNLDIIRGYLDTIDLTDFDPYAAPPMTAAKQSLIADGRTELIKDIAAAIEERAGVFARDIVTLDQIEVALGTSIRGKSKSQLRSALAALGVVSFGQQRLPVNGLVGQNWGTQRASLWAIRNTRFWDAAGNLARGDEFRRQEGLFAGWPYEVHLMSDFPPSERFPFILVHSRMT